MALPLVALSWAQIEPKEGEFDWSLVDGLLQSARQHDLRIVFLWFGSWKNTWSSYAPDWVKADYTRFPRTRQRNGTPDERLTPLSTANRDADARAFASLMQHIRAVDSQTHTVLMMQAENEVGSIPDARDYSSLANDAFAKPVPKVVVDGLTRAQRIRVGDYTLDLTPVGGGGAASRDTPPSFAIFIATAPNEYVMAGRGLGIKFTPETPGPTYVGLGTVQEGRFVDGRWVTNRQLAGDDTGQGMALTLRGTPYGPGILRVTLYRYQ
jgi:beta-galactosidase GanA